LTQADSSRNFSSLSRPFLVGFLLPRQGRVT
jgi:hypothetical protein